MEIIEYNSVSNIKIRFQDGYEKYATYQNFKDGYVRNPNLPDPKFRDKTGEIGFNTHNEKMTIVAYRSNKDFDVMFENGYISKHKNFTNFKKGTIKNLYYPALYNFGYFGEGNYVCREHGAKDDTMEYRCWHGMVKRCYDEKEHIKHPTYFNCSVCEEWANFQNFAKWFHDNLWTKNIKLMVDKDILVKGNKLYSPDTCCLVDYKINSIFTKREKDRGCLPIGVSYHKQNKKFIVTSNDGHGNEKNGSVYLGSYNSPEEAFKAYKKFKESYIKQVADEYKNKYPNFPQKLYDAMYNYEVEITD